MAAGKIPQKIKNYPILKVIGKGGMGEVYLAKHPTLNREIILKRLTIRDKDASKRFLDEAKIMLEFRHENIVQIYDHFKEENSTYIAMEYVKGKALNEVIQENEMIPIPLALFILYQSALGLHHAHTKKVIHRDIKPHNILISTTGNVKITDFGIAKRPEEDQEHKTTTGTIIGTPAYMSPEQLDAKKELSYQSDIYSLGVVFYEMITGVRPYKNELTPDVVASIAKGDFLPITKYVKKIPPIVKKILRKTFNPKIKRRYKTLIPLIKILKNYFRKFNSFEVKDSIRRLLVKTKDILQSPFFQSYERQRKRSFIFRIALLSVIVIGLLSYLFISTGRYYEWIKPKQYGRIILEFQRVDLDPDSLWINIDNKYEKAKFKFNYIKYFDDYYKNLFKKKRKNAKNIKIDPANYIEKNYSKSFYLTQGEHNINVVSGSYKNYKNVIVSPRAFQRKNKKTLQGQKVFIPIDNLWSQEVTVYFRFWDAINQTSYLFGFNHYSDRNYESVKKEEDNFKIFYHRRYINVKDYILIKKKNKEDPFRSGMRYAFMVKDFKKGDISYELKKFIIKFDIYDRTVIIHTPINPQPCRIVVISDTDKLPIYINNDTEGLLYLNNEYQYENYKNINYRKTQDKKYICELLIPPGRFNFKISKKGKMIEKRLSSGDKLEIKVTKQKDGKYIY